jgi:hypothetical protein
MFLCCEPSYYSVRPPCYDQVLTGILPHGDVDEYKMISSLTHGKRSFPPADQHQNQQLQDHVWDVIAACWSKKPKRRYKLSVVYRVFSGYSLQDALGNFNTHTDRHLTIAEKS